MVPEAGDGEKRSVCTPTKNMNPDKVSKTWQQWDSSKPYMLERLCEGLYFCASGWNLWVLMKAKRQGTMLTLQTRVPLFTEVIRLSPIPIIWLNEKQAP